MMSLAKRLARRTATIAAVSGMVMTAGAVIAPMSESASSSQLVATEGVYIRSGPGKQHSIVGSLAKGGTIKSLGDSENGWTPVNVNGRKRWISSQYLAQTGRYQAAAAAPTSGSATTTANLNGRSGPSMGNRIVKVLPRGTAVSLTGKASGEWRQVNHGGQTLWVSARYLATGAGGSSSSSSAAPVSSSSASSAKTTAYLNARTGAGLQYRIATVLSKGASVSLTGKASGEWRQITHGSRTLWVSSRYLTSSGSASGGSASGGASAPSAGSTPKVVGTRYATVALNIRTASSGGSTISEVPRGTALQITGVTQHGREQIVYQGAVRWVTAGYMSSSVPSSSDGSKGLSGLQPSAANIVAESRSKFPQITSYYGVRADSLPDHPSGRAVDIMLPNYRSNQPLGQQIADWAKANASRLNIEYVIWNQHIWSVARSREGWRYMADRGGDTANHKDHVHITVNN